MGTPEEQRRLREILNTNIERRNSKGRDWRHLPPKQHALLLEVATEMVQLPVESLLKKAEELGSRRRMVHEYHGRVRSTKGDTTEANRLLASSVGRGEARRRMIEEDGKRSTTASRIVGRTIYQFLKEKGSNQK